MLLLTSSNNGGDIMKALTAGATTTDANNRVSNIIAVDVQASDEGYFLLMP